MLYANTDDGSSALWVCDGNGIVVDNISIHGAERAPILEQINEHYGTSFTGWSDNEIGLRIGDTLPDWNAYEKIEMPQTIKLKLNVPNTPVYSFGYLNGNIFTMICQSSNEVEYALQNGQIVGGGGGDPIEFMKQYWAPKMVEQGYNVTSYQIRINPQELGEIVEDWNSYIVI